MRIYHDREDFAARHSCRFGLRDTSRATTVQMLSAAELQATVQEVIQRIIETARPQRVVLFGSVARERLTSDSDIDFLVIMHGPVHRRQLAQKIQRNLHGIAFPVDVVVVTEEDVQNSVQGGFSIIRPALAEGRVVYDAR